MSWPTGYNPFGDNRTPGLIALSSTDGKTIIPVAADPATGAILFSGIANALVASPLTGQAKIASTGTAVNLNGGTSQTLTNGIIISAASGNAATIEVGGATVSNTADGTGNGYILAAGASISFAVKNTNDIWINGTTGDIVSWAGS